jgi:hypothetical protein
MKMKIFYEEDGLNDKQKQFIIPTDEMTLPKIHNIFKNVNSDLPLDSSRVLYGKCERAQNSGRKIYELGENKLTVKEKSHIFAGKTLQPNIH